MDKVILVDKNDNEIGTEEKLKTHQEGKLHRAFSIFIFNSSDQLLIQKRVQTKYHSGGLWSNTCCSHPKPGEDILSAAHLRLKEEMGFDCDLKEIGNFIYQKKFSNGLTEYEYDHILIGYSNIRPNINKKEVEDWKWIDPDKLKNDVEKNPEEYTYWLKISLCNVLSIKN